MKSKIHKSLSAVCVLAFGFTVAAAQTPQPAPQPQPQHPPSDSNRPGLPSTVQHNTPASITLTGCLIRDTAAAGSMGGGAPSSSPGASQAPAGRSQAAPTFRLTKVEMNSHATAGRVSSGQSDAGRSRSGDTPSSPHQSAAGVTGDASEYRLVPDANVDLSAHVNHRVQVTGARSSLATGSMGRAPDMSSGSAQPPGSGASSNSGSGSAGGNTSSTPAPNQSGGSEASQRAGSMHDSTNVPALIVTNVTMIASTCQ